MPPQNPTPPNSATPPNAPPPPPPPPVQPNPMAPNQAMSGTQTTPPGSAPASGNQLPGAFSLWRPSWEALKLNFGTFFVLGLIPTLGIIILVFAVVSSNLNSFSSTSSSPSHASLGSLLLVYLVAFILGVILAPAIIYTQVKSVDGQKVRIGEAFSHGFPLVFRFIGLYILMGLATGVGLLLLIVPGIIIYQRLFLAPYIMVSENLGVVDSLKRSSALVKQHGGIWGLFGVYLVIGIVSIIPFIGGLIALAGDIAYFCAGAVRYTQIRTLAGGMPPAQPAVPAPPQPSQPAATL